MGEVVLVALVLAVLLALLAAAGFAVYRWRTRRPEAVWAPLAPLLEGPSVSGDGGGGAGSRLSGRYRGRAVVARMSPDAADAGRRGTGAYNAFDLVLEGVGARHGWQVFFGGSVGGDPGWHVTADDPTVAAQLAEEGLLELASGLGWPSTAISMVRLPVLQLDPGAGDGRLVYREDAGREMVPGPERLAFELETLLRVADLVERLDPTVDRPGGSSGGSSGGQSDNPGAAGGAAS